MEGSVRMSKRLFILLRSFFLSSFLSILLIIRRRGSMYLDSCFSLSRYCCSSAWLEPAGLMTELGFTGVFKGPGEGTLKFCGVRAVTGLWEGCGEGLGRKLLGDGAGPELTLELGCELGWPGCGDGCGGGGIDCGVCTCWPGDGEDSMVRLFWLTCAEGCPPKGMELDGTADTAVVGGNRALTCIPPWAKAAAIIWTPEPTIWGP